MKVTVKESPTLVELATVPSNSLGLPPRIQVPLYLTRERSWSSIFVWDMDGRISSWGMGHTGKTKDYADTTLLKPFENQIIPFGGIMH